MLQISTDVLKHFKNFCSSPSVIILFVYMKCRFSLSYRELEEIMIMRGASVHPPRCSDGYDVLQGLIDKRVRAILLLQKPFLEKLLARPS